MPVRIIVRESERHSRYAALSAEIARLLRHGTADDLSLLRSLTAERDAIMVGPARRPFTYAA